MTVIRSGLPGRCCPVSKGGSLHWDMPTSPGCVWLAGDQPAAGIGLKRAARIQAAVELGRRVLAARELGPDPIGSSNDVVRIFRPLLTEMKHEECWCLYLNTGNRIVERQRVSQGGVQATVVDHRLVIKRALELLATQIILVHNHPSGAALPSEQDKILTKKIAEAAALFDIRLLDHLIIARGGEYSFRQSGLLQ